MELVLRPPFDEPWFADDPFVSVEELQGKVYRELEGRRTLRYEHEGQGYFVKIHRGVGWGEIIKNLLSLRLPITGADNEWHAIARFNELGLDTMTPVAFGSLGGNPARRHSFLITEELAPVTDLEELTREWLENPPPPRFRRALIRRLANILRIMHEGGVNHRDCYLCHFLLHTPVDYKKPPRPFVIDLHRAQLRKKVPTRWKTKDVAGLYFSALHLSLSEREKLSFLRWYYGRPLKEVLSDSGHQLVAIEAKAKRTLEHHLKHHAK